MTPEQFNYRPVVAPQPSGVGRILLASGRELVGTWSWNINLKAAHLTEASGIQWIIDVTDIVAFSPPGPTPVGDLELSSQRQPQETL